MPRIKAVIAAGVEPAVAVKAALGMTIREFAERYDVAESAVSGVIHGSTPYLYARVRDALARHLEVERAYIDEILPPPRRRAGRAAAQDPERGRSAAGRGGSAAADPPAGGDAFADGAGVPACAGRRGGQEGRAMAVPAKPPARVFRPRTAGIAQRARDWLRLAGPRVGSGAALASTPAR